MRTFPPMAAEDDFVTWGDVAARLATSKTGTLSALARALDMQPSSLSRSVGRATGDLTVPVARAIARFFAGDEGHGPGMHEPSVQPFAPTRTLPAFGYVAAANDHPNDRFRFGPGQELDYHPLPAGLTLDPAQYFVVIQPSSMMEPRVFAGEALVIRRNGPAARDRLAMIEFMDGTATIKNYRGARAGRIFAEQFNPPESVDYPALEVRAIHGVYLAL